MRGIYIQDVTDKVTISALNYYGADFKVDVYDQDTNTYIYQNLPMIESAEPITNISTLVSENRTAGVESIKVNSVTGYQIHDRITLSSGASEIFRIVSIDAVNNELGLHKATKIDVTTLTTVNISGALGLYWLDLTMSNIGTFLIKAKDSVYGLQRTDAIKVVTQKQAREFKILV